MILSILIIAIYAALHVVLFMFIAKDIRLIETNYSRAAGYGMRRMKIILLVLSLLLVPLTIAIGVFLTAAPIFDPGVSSVIAIVVLILACALTETILLNRGEEKHRVLPWALAAVNLISALLLIGLLPMTALAAWDAAPAINMTATQDGDEITVEAPVGQLKYAILEIKN